MPGADIVRYMCKTKGITIKQLSEMMGCPHQSLKNKQYRDTYPYKEVEYIADLLGFDLIAVQHTIATPPNPTEEAADE